MNQGIRLGTVLALLLLSSFVVASMVPSEDVPLSAMGDSSFLMHHSLSSLHDEMNPSELKSLEDELDSEEKEIEKRGTVKKSKIGKVHKDLLVDFTITSDEIPPNAYKVLGRRSKCGGLHDRDYYIAHYKHRHPNGTSHGEGNLWGILFRDPEGILQAHFPDRRRWGSFKDARKDNITTFQVLVRPDNIAEVYDTEYDWAPAKTVDRLSIIVQTNTSKYHYRKRTPGIFFTGPEGAVEDCFFVGMANMENRVITHTIRRSLNYYEEFPVYWDSYDAERVKVLVKKTCGGTCRRG